MAIISRVKSKTKIGKLFNSLYIRIAAVILFCGILPCTILYASLLAEYESRDRANLTANIQNQCSILANQVELKNYFEEPNSETIEAEARQLASIFTGRVLIVNKDLEILTDSYDLDQGKTLVSGEAISGLQGEGSAFYNDEEGYIEVITPVRLNEETEPDGVIIASVSSTGLSDTTAVVREKIRILGICLAAILILIAATLPLLFTRRIRMIGKQLETSVETYDLPLEGLSSYTETDAILTAVDKTMSRMRSLDQTRQEFVSNVSHELKTPITSMKVLADSLIGQEDVPLEIYREFMEDIASEIDREAQIIDELLSLVRLDKEAALSIESKNIEKMIEVLLRRLQPIAAQKRIELVMESDRPVFAEVDEAKLSLAFSNLMENAIKYNKEQGWVHVQLTSDHRYFYLRVADNGMGIPEEEQQHVFERFYRGDKSHSTQIKGTGLGLAITRNAVALHHGTIELKSEVGVGTIFTVRIPLHYND